MIKAVLFDLDGVLVDMPSGHFEALNKALGLFGANINEEEHRNFFNGLPTKKKVAELEKQGRLPEGLRDFIFKIKQKYTREVIPKYCAPDYSKIILLKHLKNKGYKLACVSNSIRESIELMLKAADLYEHFDFIIGNDEVTNSKPHPEIYLKTFERLGVKPNECVIVEDAPPGVAAAKASGAVVCAVRGTPDVNLSLFKNILDI